MADTEDFIDGVLRRFFGKVVHRHRELRRSCRLGTTDTLLDWSRRHLPDHFAKQPSRMHRWLSETLGRLETDRGTKLNLLAPRGAAKSTIGTLAYPLRETLEGREPYVWIVSDTMSQAHAHLENIKNELLTNESLARRCARNGNPAHESPGPGVAAKRRYDRGKNPDRHRLKTRDSLSIHGREQSGRPPRTRAAPQHLPKEKHFDNT